MNFLERVKRDLEDSHGAREKVLINYQALRELVDHFERLDSYARAIHPDQKKRRTDMYKYIEHELAMVIEAMYHQQGRDAETTLMTIMETLLPLMQKRHKENNKPISYWQNKPISYWQNNQYK